MKFLNLFMFFGGHFCPPGSGTGSTDLTETESESGSERLEANRKTSLVIESGRLAASRETSLAIESGYKPDPDPRDWRIVGKQVYLTQYF
jgi:hypothetical protein